MSEPTQAPLDRARRCELLAATPGPTLIALADQVIEDAGPPTVVLAPELGMTMVTVREPVEAIRFHVGEVLVCRAEVDHRGTSGWAMRMGEDRAATLAAALLDAEAAADGPRRSAIDELCRTTELMLAEDRAREWAELAATTVHFEELDA